MYDNVIGKNIRIEGEYNRKVKKIGYKTTQKCNRHQDLWALPKQKADFRYSPKVLTGPKPHQSSEIGKENLEEQ